MKRPGACTVRWVLAVAWLSPDLFADAAIDFVREHAARKAGRPFLAYVAFTAPHDPRTPPEPYRSW